MQFDEIVSITKIKNNSLRYDISVEDNHNFYANGILVHNCQNLKKELSEWNEQNVTWEVTEKLDGSSMTVYLKTNFYEDSINILNQEFGVCSRNIDLKEDENNAFWKEAIKLNLKEKLKSLGGVSVALQGELVGEGIQGNPYNLKGVEFYLFDVFDITEQRYWHPIDEESLAKRFGLKHCPVLDTLAICNEYSIDDLLQLAEGKSVLNENVEREGVVFKSHPYNREETFSFKAISNKFLMGEK